MKSMLVFGLILFITACHKTAPPEETAEVNEPVAVSKPVVKPEVFSRSLRESIYFANSLEREALKLITKDSSFQKQTLFSVLSFVVETSSGAKKTTPSGLDCGTFTVLRSGSEISVLKACSVKKTELAHIHIKTENDKVGDYEFNFTINEWSSVLGMAVTLTGSNVHCNMRVELGKLQKFNCENWSYLTSEEQFSSTLVKTKEFAFDRNAAKQFVIKGGFFKELIENKKIDIVVPLEGKIKIIEKEIRVIDEFAEKKKEALNEKESPKDSSKEKLPEISKEEYEKIIKPENPAEISEGQQPAESESRDQSNPRGSRGR